MSAAPDPVLDLDVLAHEVIAMAAPVILGATDLTARDMPDPLDVAALIMSAGLNLRGRTELDLVGLAAALDNASKLRSAGMNVAAAGALIAIALRARELEDGHVLAQAWSRALAWLP